MTAKKKSSGRPSRGRSRRRKASPYGPEVVEHATSHPTSRNAYQETREWLLKQHGPICAYCGKQFPTRTMTLDHVTPRRGQTAYDRRDNLVLACKTCNSAKADAPILKFLLEKRGRAKNLARFGKHLSPMLVKIARDLAGPGPLTSNPYERGEDSPYAD